MDSAAVRPERSGLDAGRSVPESRAVTDWERRVDAGWKPQKHGDGPVYVAPPDRLAAALPPEKGLHHSATGAAGEGCASRKSSLHYTRQKPEGWKGVCEIWFLISGRGSATGQFWRCTEFFRIKPGFYIL